MEIEEGAELSQAHPFELHLADPGGGGDLLLSIKLYEK
jgi:hypothetical protein